MDLEKIKLYNILMKGDSKIIKSMEMVESFIKMDKSMKETF